MNSHHCRLKFIQRIKTINASFIFLRSFLFSVWTLSDHIKPLIVYVATFFIAKDSGCSSWWWHMFHVVCVIGGCRCWVPLLPLLPGSPDLKSFSPSLLWATAGYRNRAWQQTAYSLTLLLLSDCLALKSLPLWFTPPSKPCLHLRHVSDT